MCPQNLTGEQPKINRRQRIEDRVLIDRRLALCDARFNHAHGVGRRVHEVGDFLKRHFSERRPVDRTESLIRREFRILGILYRPLAPTRPDLIPISRQFAG